MKCSWDFLSCLRCTHGNGCLARAVDPDTASNTVRWLTLICLNGSRRRERYRHCLIHLFTTMESFRRARDVITDQNPVLVLVKSRTVHLTREPRQLHNVEKLVNQRKILLELLSFRGRRRFSHRKLPCSPCHGPPVAP